MSNDPWNPESAPIEIMHKQKRIPSWKIYNGMTGPIPDRIPHGLVTEKNRGGNFNTIWMYELANFSTIAVR